VWVVLKLEEDVEHNVVRELQEYCGRHFFDLVIIGVSLWVSVNFAKWVWVSSEFVRLVWIGYAGH
jgi:hypothetical protein